jgi:hypothetical protein
VGEEGVAREKEERKTDYGEGGGKRRRGDERKRVKRKRRRIKKWIIEGWGKRLNDGEYMNDEKKKL